jgi:hypothetical protein
MKFWRSLSRALVIATATCTSIAVLRATPTIAAQGQEKRDINKHGIETSCKLDSKDGKIKHVIFIQFDNTHFRRDNPNVPSDLEQMPSLLNFIRNKGTLLTNDHTVLISHTAGGILSSLTGVYPDRHGQTVSNSYVRTSNTGTFSFPSSFGYWTDPVSANGTPTVLNMVGPDGANVPAPWVAYTRAGCDFGAIATANVVLENTGTGATGDVTKVFGSGSSQWNQAVASNSAPAGTAARAKAQTDFVGFAIHCAQGSAICANGHDDLLPQEVGGYDGFRGLFGAQEINPLLTAQPGTVPLTDLLGQPITDPFGQPGFPGFDGMSAAASLAYVAAMQESGIPITYAYISDAHDFHGVAGSQHVAFGPGDPGYVQQLKAYDDAFAAFFKRLNSKGITNENTLFVFTVDEGDHFVGVQKNGCDGVTKPCVYGANEVGEINANIDTLVSDQFPSLKTNFLSGAASPYAFTVHGDDAPTFYLAKKGTGGGQLAQTDPVAREFERDMAKLTAVNPYTGATDPLMVRMADQTGMTTLHMMTTGDPVRNASFVFFGDANYFLTDFPANTCKTCINPLFAWNHGDIQNEIGNTWLGFVGPGVGSNGQDDQTWSDHTDVRPTILSLIGLEDSYAHDGRVLFETMDENALPVRLRGHKRTLPELVNAFKQINAPFGQLALDSLTISTAALTSNTTNDALYAALQSKIAGFTSQRDAIADDMKAMLDGAAFGNEVFDEVTARQLVNQAQALLQDVKLCGANPAACAQ